MGNPTEKTEIGSSNALFCFRIIIYWDIRTQTGRKLTFNFALSAHVAFIGVASILPKS